MATVADFIEKTGLELSLGGLLRISSGMGEMDECIRTEGQDMMLYRPRIDQDEKSLY